MKTFKHSVPVHTPTPFYAWYIIHWSGGANYTKTALLLTFAYMLQLVSGFFKCLPTIQVPHTIHIYGSNKLLHVRVGFHKEEQLAVV
jgi:hypothetical protein